MEGRVWNIVLQQLPEPSTNRSRFVYDRRTILMVLLWAALHDRTQKWSCDPEHWPTRLRPRHLPDPSTLCRRIRSDGVLEEFSRILMALGQRVGPPTRDAAIDSRPLVVGGASKDSQATAGRGVGGFSRGYRAHMLVDRLGVVRGLLTRPINVNDRVPARELLGRAAGPIRRIVGDANYDSVQLHKIAGRVGKRFYTPIRGNHVGRRADPRRIQLLKLWQTRVGRETLKARDGIERVFARMSNLAFGLKPLPGWVRGLRRVDLWIHAKIIFYHAYLVARQ